MDPVYPLTLLLYSIEAALDLGAQWLHFWRLFRSLQSFFPETDVVRVYSTHFFAWPECHRTQASQSIQEFALALSFSFLI